MKNWKTSVFGTLASVLAGVAASLQGSKLQPVVGAAAVLFGAIFALVSKDHNVTGGTTAQ